MDDIFLDTLNKVTEKIRSSSKNLPMSKADIKHRNKVRRKAKKERKKKLSVIKNINTKSVSKKSNRVDFYNSDEWKSIRYKVLVKFGATCQCCGATRKDGVQIHVDHIKPRSLYPHLELVESNLQVLCEMCNLGKSNVDSTDWR